MHIHVCRSISEIYMYLSLKNHKDFLGDTIPLVLACLATVLLSLPS